MTEGKLAALIYMSMRDSLQILEDSGSKHAFAASHHIHEIDPKERFATLKETTAFRVLLRNINEERTGGQ